MENPKIKYLKDYTAPDFLVQTIDLTFDLGEEQTKVTSIMHISKNKDVADETTPLIFDMKEMEIESVIAQDMILLPKEYETGQNFFKLARTPDDFTLEITSIVKPQENTSLEGLYKSGDMFCTQCEAEGFRKITPYPDRPDVMARFTTTIIADQTKYPVLLSNGNPVKNGKLENGRHFVTWEDPFKKPCYLFALVAGDLECIKDQFKTDSGRNVDLHIYVEKENADKCNFAMTALKQAMKWDEQRFGLEYDLDLYQIVVVNDFNAGAMENKGLNIFNSKYVLADPKTATDIDFLNIQSVIAHEYFHNWTGNRVTLKNWFQLSLKEGLTVFRDREFSSDLNSRSVKRISDVKNLRTYQFPEDSGPMTHPVRPESYIEMNNFYTMTVYEKGSEVVRIIHQIVGEKNFRQGMDLYFERFDGMAVTIEDFIKVMEDASRIDLTQFKLWYSQSGTPQISMKRQYDNQKKELCIYLDQSIAPDRNQSEKKPMHIPVKFGLLDPDGNDVTPEGCEMLHLKEHEQSFVFTDVPNNCVPSIFRDFSAPVKIDTDLNDEELAFLLANDKDKFNRWDAAQTLYFKEIKSLIEDIEQDKPLKVSEHILHAFQKSLVHEPEERAFLSRALQLPDEVELKERFTPINVDAIHNARKFLKEEIASKMEQELMSVIEVCSKSDPASLSFQAMSDRGLKNLSLSYIGSIQKGHHIQFIYDHYQTAQNMTDEIACLKILSNSNTDFRQKAIETFYMKWQHDKLVLDKWFAIQAGSFLKDTLNEVKTLLSHPDFSIKNPNKVRSLIGVFAMLNPVNFHRIDGKGYEFVAEQILILDAINPQIASRIASCFNHWKRYEDKRKDLMEAELKRIISHDTLSKNVYEIISRALE